MRKPQEQTTGGLNVRQKRGVTKKKRGRRVK